MKSVVKSAASKTVVVEATQNRAASIFERVALPANGERDRKRRFLPRGRTRVIVMLAGNRTTMFLRDDLMRDR